MLLNICVSQRHVQTLQRTTKIKECMQRILHQIEWISYQMRLRFDTFLSKMTNISCWGSNQIHIDIDIFMYKVRRSHSRQQPSYCTMLNRVA